MSSSKTPLFGHERLDVYREAIAFELWAGDRLENIPKSLAAHDQLDRSSTSIPLNIAEGNGKWSRKDRCRFFDIAWGSCLESASAIDVLVARKALELEEANPGKQMLAAMVRMLVGLIKANDPERKFGDWSMREESAEYGNFDESGAADDSGE